MLACQRLANYTLVSESDGTQERAELAGMALYQLREILRPGFSYARRKNHQFRECILARLKALVKDDALVDTFCSLVCQFGSEAIHNPNTLQLRGFTYGEVSSLQMEEISLYANRILDKEITFEKLLMPSKTKAGVASAVRSTSTIAINAIGISGVAPEA